MSKPLYKEAWELQKEYEKHGVKYCYNQRNKIVYLSILAAPTFSESTPEAQMTGYLMVYGGVIASRNIKKYVDEVKHNYIKHYQNDPIMLQYVDTII